MQRIKTALLASLLLLAAGTFLAATTATACPGADKATTADEGE